MIHAVEATYEGRVTDWNDGGMPIAIVRYLTTWTEPPEILLPGKVLSIDMKIDEIERSMADRALMIGEMKVCAGVSVTAGREWIQTNIVGNKARSDSLTQGMSALMNPSPQLFACDELEAGCVEGVWTPSADETLAIAIPDKIPDRTTFQTPAKNIPGEQVLVLIHVLFLSVVHVVQSYLYEAAVQHDGTQVWKLLGKGQDIKEGYSDPEGEVTVTMRQRR